LFNFNLKDLLYLIGIFTINLPCFSFNPVKSEILNESIYLEDKVENNLNNNFEFLNLNNNDFSNDISIEFKDVLTMDIIKFQNKFLRQIALNKKSDITNFSLEIESNVQYEIENIYYAEGNVIIYFSNAILQGDKVEYDKLNKILKVEGNVVFKKGAQYFEASKVFYNLEKNKGYVDSIYGVLDMKSFVNDFEFKNLDKENILQNDKTELKELEYIDNVSIGLVNDFEKSRKFNLTSIQFDVASITKWRYKSKKILFEDSKLFSENILFTNDALNKPQFILSSKNFSGEIIDKKIKLISRKSSIILDDKLKIPIGKRTIYAKEPISTWGIGSDYNDKDGLYISKGFNPIKLNDDINLKFRPYILLQRAFKGTTDSFTAPNSSLLSQQVKNNILFSDLFALDTNINADLNKFNLNLNTKLNTFNTNRSSEALRAKFTLEKVIDLNSINKDLDNEFDNSSENFVELKSIEENDRYLENEIIKSKEYINFLNLKFTSSFRDTISKGYSGEHEIYFGNSFSISNRKSWVSKNKKTDLAFIYDVGKFKAKSKNNNIYNNLYRNVLASKLSFKVPLWKKFSIDNYIDSSYKYSPKVINEGLDWVTDIQSGVFFYSNGSSQEGLSISSGPNLVFGRFKNNWFDYTNLTLKNTYIAKSGESPFAFDDINDSFMLNMNIKQQLYGPIVISYETSLDIDNGEFSKPNYYLDIKRRAYSLGAFYNTSNRSIGLNFNIFNFNYLGKSEKF
tara:strand:+ start:4837 stop:7050 length:2214 start_codon:yes stop_codon:yes gene_type:complete